MVELTVQTIVAASVHVLIHRELHNLKDRRSDELQMRSHKIRSSQVGLAGWRLESSS